MAASRAPFTGTWKPFEPLGGLLDASADGNWTFTVTDSAAHDTGSIRAVSLELTGFERAERVKRRVDVGLGVVEVERRAETARAGGGHDPRPRELLRARPGRRR